MRVIQLGAAGIFLLFALGCGFLSQAPPKPTSPQNAIVAPTAPPTLAPLPPTVPGAQTFALAESDLNQLLNQNLPPGGEVSNVVLDLHAGNTANVSATLRLNSLSLQPNALLRATVADNRIAIEVTQVRVGGFGVPSSMIEPQIAELKNMAERELNSQLAKLEANTGLELQALETTENEMRLYFAP